jgi:hypothetical protein
MREVVIKPEGLPPEVQEVEMLSRELAGAFRARVGYFRKELGLPVQEAVAKAEERCSLSQMWRVEDCPPEEVSWSDLLDLSGVSPERALRRWEDVKQAAREELQSGERAARAVEGPRSDTWDRARFLALRENLAREWQPRNGMEQRLIDQMAQAQTLLDFWQERLMLLASTPLLREKRQVEEEGGWNPPRVSEHQTIEQAAGMVDRFHKMYLRALRSLCNLRKAPLAVVVQNAGQVNLGQQQVNTQKGEHRKRREGRRVQGKRGACTCEADRLTFTPKRA